MRTILVDLLYAYALVLFVRVILSWLLPSVRSDALRQIDNALAKVTDPVLNPIRRALPRTTMIDFSPTIAIVVCYILARVIQG